MKRRSSRAPAVFGTALLFAAHARAEGGGTPSPPSDPLYGVGSVGLLYSGVLGPLGGHAVGGEASYTYFPEHGPPATGFGGFVQLQAYPLDSVRTAAGAQFVYSLVGAELGWSYRSAAGTHDGTHGLHVAPFLSIGFLHIAPRGTIAFRNDDRSWGTEFALTVGLKAPFPAPNFPDYINLNMPHGRPLRSAPFAEPRLAKVQVRRRDGRFTRRPGNRNFARWARVASEEHASVATFARLTEELAALGAPAELVCRALGAAVEERGHAEEALRIASRFAGCSASLGALPAALPRAPSLSELVVESYFDGCLGEGLAAEVARRLQRRGASRQERRFHALVAREERSHAELAWSVVRWGLSTGEKATGDALGAALRIPLVTPRRPGSRDAARVVERRARRRLGRWLAAAAPTLQVESRT